jgi:hypothetical protein
MTRIWFGPAVVGLAMVLMATSAGAQQVEIEAPAPRAERAPIVVPPGDHDAMTRPSDADYYPEAPKVRYDPTFVGPLSQRFETRGGTTGRAGIAGWTAPQTPVGAESTARREVNGWFALGFAIEWGGPPPPGRRPVR